jgi:hypothetical protein
MKKMFVMILLLWFSMPTFAQEVKLICSHTSRSGETQQIPLTFDADKKTLNFMGAQNARFSDTNIDWYERVPFSLSRITGELLMDGVKGVHYQCSRFQQAF